MILFEALALMAIQYAIYCSGDMYYGGLIYMKKQCIILKQEQKKYILHKIQANFFIKHNII